MRSQAIGVAQLDTFETTAAQPTKTDSVEDNFATALHHAAGDTVTVPVVPNTVTSDESEHSKGLMSHTPSKQVQSEAIPATLARMLPLQKKVELSTARKNIVEKSSPHSSESNAISPTKESSEHSPIATDISSCPSSILDPMQVRTQPWMRANGKISLVNTAIDDSNSLNPATIIPQKDTTKAVDSETKTLHAKSLIVGNKVKFVANKIVTNSASDPSASKTILQSVISQSQAIVTPTVNLTTANEQPTAILANKMAPASVIQVQRRGEATVDRKVSKRATEETITSPEADTSVDGQTVSGFDSSILEKNFSSSSPALADANAESSLHEPIASGLSPLSSSMLLTHSPDPKSPTVVLTLPGHITEDVDSTTAMQLYTPAPPSTSSLPHVMLSATATSLEVGVTGGTHGWLKIRAEMTETGGVNASLTGSSSIAANRLENDLPALNSYLQAEKIQTNGLVVHVATLSEATAAAAMSSDRSTYEGSGGLAGNAHGDATGGQPQQQNEQGTNNIPVPIGGEAGPEVSLNRISDRTMLGDRELLDEGRSLASVVYGTGGGWLNVRA